MFEKRRLKGICISLFILNSFNLFGQKKDFIRHEVEFKVQNMIQILYDKDGNSNYDPDFQIGLNTFVRGISSEINYFFSPYVGLGIGVGYEYINQPKITYYPVYFNMVGVLSDDKSTLYVKFNFGNHFGKMAKRGFIFRAGIGGRVKIYKKILSYLELTYSYQNLYKTFELSPRPVNYYNIESIGLTIGIGIGIN